MVQFGIEGEQVPGGALNPRPYTSYSDPGVGQTVCTCAACGALVDKIAQLAVADEGAFGVLTVAVEADVWVQVTLVHICVDGLKHEGSSLMGTCGLVKDCLSSHRYTSSCPWTP